MKKLRFHIARFVTFLVALQILNMGLFAQDFQFNLAPSSSSLTYENVINSVTEFVSEIVLNHINAMPENNDGSCKDLREQKHFSVKMVELQNKVAVLSIPEEKAEIQSSFLLTSHYQFCKEITPPPPKA